MSKVPVVVAACSVVVSCSKDDPPATPVLAASAVVAPPEAVGPKSIKYVVDPAGKTSIDMPAPAEHIRATTNAAGGEIVIDPSHVAETHGQVKVDLTTLTTTTFGIESKDKAQTEHAHNWLEAGDLVTPEVKEGNRWAIFTIRSVEGLASADLRAVAPVPAEADDTRTVAVTARGDFFVHGHQVPRSADLDVVFHYAKGSPPTARADSVEIRTRSPLHVILAEHDVKPRDGFGKLAQQSFNLLGTKVAETADVTFDLTARPVP